FGVPLLQIYGMTEQLGWPLANPLHGRRDNMTLGRPTLPFRCQVVDEYGQAVRPGVPGQLLVNGVAGVSLMKGYYKNPEATADVVLHVEQAATAEEMIAWCAERLARFRVPEHVEFRTDLPRTSVGKIQKHLLRAEAPAPQ